FRSYMLTPKISEPDPSERLSVRIPVLLKKHPDGFGRSAGVFSDGFGRFRTTRTDKFGRPGAEIRTDSDGFGRLCWSRTDQFGRFRTPVSHKRRWFYSF